MAGNGQLEMILLPSRHPETRVLQPRQDLPQIPTSVGPFDFTSGLALCSKPPDVPLLIGNQGRVL
jgi:hypothetical protein